MMKNLAIYLKAFKKLTSIFLTEEGTKLSLPHLSFPSIQKYGGTKTLQTLPHYDP